MSQAFAHILHITHILTYDEQHDGAPLCDNVCDLVQDCCHQCV